MALPASGEISMVDINTELGDANAASTEIELAGSSATTSTSLFGSATSAVNKIPPHRMSEFHGYTHVGGGGGGGAPPPGGGGGGPSERSLKKNIKLMGISPSGLNIYTFEFKEGRYTDKYPGKWQGVIADEVKDMDNVVFKMYGNDWVDYSKLDVEFKKIT